MSCERTELELAAYLDGELDLTSAVALEQHVTECSRCAEALAAQRALREAVGAAGLRYLPSPSQARRFRRTVREAAGGSAATVRPWGWLQAAAAFLVVAVASFSLGRFAAPRDGTDLGAEVVASHVRSLLAGRPADVVSSDHHTVKPWFSGKLDYAPVVVDLAGDGFALAGGRLDYVGRHPVAALIYRSGRHVITLFTWPVADSPDSSGTALHASERQGFHVLHWSRAGMTFWAVSDAAEEPLRRFAQLLIARSH